MLRITPAWAGKSEGTDCARAENGDHPRVGGEKKMYRTAGACFSGSPPRGRGKVAVDHFLHSAAGITPAWAGKRAFFHDSGRMPRDHPRVGGEKMKASKKGVTSMGSPPRGRGKVKGCDLMPDFKRITPAWAGKRLKRSHRSGIFISGPIPFHSVLHRPAGSGGSRAGRDGSPAGQPQNTGPA